MHKKQLVAVALTIAMIVPAWTNTVSAAANTTSNVVKNEDTIGTDVGVEEIDDKDSRIQYSGSWQPWLEEGLYNGTQSYSTQGEASATLTFEGVGIQVTGVKSSENSLMNVYIDGQLYQKKIDTYAPGYSSKVNEPLFAVDGLTYGTHTIKVELSSQKESHHKGIKLGLDSFRIFKTSQNFVNQITLSTSTGKDTLDYVGDGIKMISEVTPDAANKEVLWSVSPATSASIAQDGTLTAKATSGKVTVKATALDGSMREATKEITINTTNEGDMDTLIKNYEKYSILDSKEYTKASWTGFAKALDEAKTVMGMEKPQPATILEALRNLKEGQFNLVIRKMKIACVGDSITYGSASNPMEYFSYPAQLQSTLGDYYEVENFGVRSSTANYDNDMSYAKTEAYKKSLEFAPDAVVIMLGTNDSKNNNWVSPEYYKECVTKLVESYKSLESNPKIFLATSPAVSEKLDTLTSVDTGNRIHYSRINDTIVPLQRELAQSLGCNIIDVHQASADEVFWSWDYLNKDMIHPNNDGYTIISKKMYLGLMSTIGDLTDLDTAIANAESRISELTVYTKESREKYLTILEEVKHFRVQALRENVTQNIIDAQITKLNDAKQSLIRKSVTITNTDTSVKIGQNYQFKAKRAGITYDVIWSVSDTAVGTIDKSTGVFTAKSKGSVIVTASCGNYTAKKKITVQ